MRNRLPKSFQLGGLLILAACLGDPVGPDAPLRLVLVEPFDTLFTGAPATALSGSIVLRVVDGKGAPVAGVRATWMSEGAHSSVAEATSEADREGLLRANWILGTNAAEVQRLRVWVHTQEHGDSIVLRAIVRPVDVAAVEFGFDTATTNLGIPSSVVVRAIDPYGNTFLPADLELVSTDTASLRTSSPDTVVGFKRGYTKLLLRCRGHADTGWVHVMQVADSVRAAQPVLVFHSLGQQVQLEAATYDIHGFEIADTLPDASVLAPEVVELGSDLSVRSIANGMTRIIVRVGTAVDTVLVSVQQRVATVGVQPSALQIDALGDTLDLTVTQTDSLNAPVTGAAISFGSSDTSVASVTSSGRVISHRNGTTWVSARSPDGPADSITITVSQRVALVRSNSESILFESLTAQSRLELTILDRLGSVIASAVPTYSVEDSTIASVDSTGTAMARKNGSTRVVASVGRLEAIVGVTVSQQPKELRLGQDTIRFDALGDSALVSGVVVDSLGWAVPPPGQTLTVTSVDSSVVALESGVWVHARRNGIATLAVEAPGVRADQSVLVSQVATTVTASLTFPKPIVTIERGALLPITCVALDRNGNLLDSQSTVRAERGTVTSGSCDSSLVVHSGLDTLVVSMHGVVQRIPVTIAVTPIRSSRLGDFVVFDSFPSVGTSAWGLSARQNSHGEMEIYFSAYTALPDSTGYTRSDLHRAVWLGGLQFRYDGVVLTHEAPICDQQGMGLEHVVILPRAEQAGWRMLYSAGSFLCWGFQVFSAVSDDERTWVKEPGVRLANGSVSGEWPPWPVGEGMAALRTPNGDWQLIVGGFEHVTSPSADEWQITEWRSADQLNWEYTGTVLTTRDMPPEGAGTIFGPSIREISPGLWRMVFSGDNRRSGSPYRSRLWSAVSTDRQSWQLEGELMGDTGSDLFYAGIVNDFLIYLRRDGEGDVRVAMATVLMP
jgi:hypothetical protein